MGSAVTSCIRLTRSVGSNEPVFELGSSEHGVAEWLLLLMEGKAQERIALASIGQSFGYDKELFLGAAFIRHRHSTPC